MDLLVLVLGEAAVAAVVVGVFWVVGVGTVGGISCAGGGGFNVVVGLRACLLGSWRQELVWVISVALGMLSSSSSESGR